MGKFIDLLRGNSYPLSLKHVVKELLSKLDDGEVVINTSLTYISDLESLDYAGAIEALGFTEDDFYETMSKAHFVEINSKSESYHFSCKHRTGDYGRSEKVALTSENFDYGTNQMVTDPCLSFFRTTSGTKQFLYSCY